MRAEYQGLLIFEFVKKSPLPYCSVFSSFNTVPLNFEHISVSAEIIYRVLVYFYPNYTLKHYAHDDNNDNNNFPH